MHYDRYNVLLSELQRCCYADLLTLDEAKRAILTYL